MSDISDTSTTVVDERPPPAPAPTQPVFRPRPAGITMEQMVSKYLGVRDQIAEIKKAQELALKPYQVALNTIGMWLLQSLDETSQEAARTRAGTAYKSVRTSAVVENWSETLAFIRANEAWELLEARVSKLAVEAVMEDTKAAVPGVRTSREIIVNVRRS